MTKKIETKTTEIALNPSVWGVDFNADLIAQVLYVMRSNARHGNASAKRRSDVRGGGRKPWKQKGTGRARVGSNRSPLWNKGGVTFVPNFRNWARKINKKMRKLAVAVLLSERLRKGNLEFVNIESKDNMAQTRTMFMGMIKGIRNLVITSDEQIEQSLRNVVGVEVIKPENVNAFALALARNIIIDNQVVNVIEKNILNEK